MSFLLKCSNEDLKHNIIQKNKYHQIEDDCKFKYKILYKLIIYKADKSFNFKIKIKTL